MNTNRIVSIRHAIQVGREAYRHLRGMDARAAMLDGRNAGATRAARARHEADIATVQDYLREQGGDADRAEMWMREEDRLVRSGAAPKDAVGHARLLLARRVMRDVSDANRP